MRMERTFHILAKSFLSCTRWGAIVIGQVKMTNAMIKGIVYDIKSLLFVVMLSKVMPKAK